MFLGSMRYDQQWTHSHMNVYSPLYSDFYKYVKALPPLPFPCLPFLLLAGAGYKMIVLPPYQCEEKCQGTQAMLVGKLWKSRKLIKQEERNRKQEVGSRK